MYFDNKNWRSIPSKIILIVVFFGILQFCFSFWINISGHGFHHIEDKINLSLTDGQRTLYMNPDEESNFKIAKNNIDGHGYSHFNNTSKTYKPSAFHSSFTVFLYERLILSGLDFDLYIIFYYLITSILHSISLLALYQILKPIGHKFAFLGLSLWALFPSTIYFINPLFLYESFCTAGLIIIYERICKVRLSGDAKCHDLIIILFLSMIGVFLRLQLIPILISLFSFTIIFPGKAKRFELLFGMVIIMTLISLMSIPVLEKNKKDFGRYVISTQSGFELWEGSNPLARGSWSGSGESRKLGMTNIPNVENLNQLELSDKLKYKAIAWATSHPYDYFVLSLRKLAIYFLPQNYEVMPGSRFYNPINAIVYFAALFFIFTSIFRNKDIPNTMVLIAPILGSISLTLVFFVGYRWRYYAEPFMLICSIYMLNSLKKNQ